MGAGDRRSAGFGLLRCLAIGVALAVSACGTGEVTPRVIYVTLAPGPTVTPAAAGLPGETATPTGSALPGETAPATAPALPSESASPTTSSTPSATPAPVAPTVKGTTFTDSGNTAACGNWTISVGKPVVSGVSGEAVAAMNSAITARIDAFLADFKAQLSTGGGAGPCTLDGSSSVALVSASLLSLRFSMLEYLGGASDSQLAGSINVTVSTGVTITLADLFTDPASGVATLSTESRTRLAALLGPDGIGSDSIDPGTTPVLSNFDKAWVFTAAGLELTFAEFQVASHAEGTPRITIPWSVLKAVINPSGPAGQFIR